MNLKVARAIRQPFAGRNWAIKLGIGAVITLVAALAGQFGMLGGFAKFLVGSLTAGFALRVMQNEASSNEGLMPLLPEWNNWQDLFMRGMTMSFVNSVFVAAFGLIVALLGTAFGAGAAMSTIATTGSFAPLAGISGVFMVVVFALGLGFALTLTMLNVHFACENRFTAYIEFGPALRRAFARPGNTAVAALVSLAVVAVSAVLGFIPIIGAAVGAFFAQVALGSLWAQVYRLGR